MGDRAGSSPVTRTTSSRTAYRSRRRFLFKENAASHSLRRSSFQNQNRMAAPCLVDNFGISLCLVLILAFGGAICFDLGVCCCRAKGADRPASLKRERGLPSPLALFPCRLERWIGFGLLRCTRRRGLRIVRGGVPFSKKTPPLIHSVAPPFKIKTAWPLHASLTTSAFRCAWF